MTWLIYIFIGAFAGVLAGLFGVGGGAIIVPIFILIFTLQGFAAESLIHLAVGTSFATIMVTSASSVTAHHKLGNVNWLVFKSMAPGLVLGVLLGAVVATSLNGHYLQLGIGVFLMLVAVQMFIGVQPRGAFSLPSCRVLVSGGFVVGWLSAFFGIGGGSLTVPFLSAFREPMQRAVATSAACGLPIAFFGALTYGFKGFEVGGLPDLTTGYIYWPAFLGVAIASAPCAHVGAMLAERASDAALKKGFSLLLFCIGLQLLMAH